MNNSLLKNILKSFFCIFMFLESKYIQLIFVFLFKIKKITPKVQIGLSTISSIIIVSLLIFIYRKELINEFKIYKNKFSDNFDIGIKYWLIGLAGMFISNLIINLLFNTGQSNNEQLVQKMISSFPILMIINAGVIGPINEEILFRKCFRNIFKNNYLFVIVSGLVFGFLHVSTASTLGQQLFIIPYSLLGFCFALMYIKTKSVFTSMSMHMIHNMCLVLFSILI